MKDGWTTIQVDFDSGWDRFAHTRKRNNRLYANFVRGKSYTPDTQRYALVTLKYPYITTIYLYYYYYYIYMYAM